MALHNDIGKTGEDAAVLYLQGKGYTIRHRNWKLGRKELDIIATDGRTLVIVEVKTRTDNRYGSPVEAVTEQKMKRIMTAANAYVRYFQLDCPVRFDIISLILTPKGLQIEHIEDAFMSPIW